MRRLHLAALALSGIAATGGLASAASAQADTPPETFSISPAVRTVYDSNILRLGRERAPGDRDDVVVTPNLDIDVRQLLGGRHLLTVSGTAGYDLHRRYRFLNRERIDLSGDVDVIVGGACRVRPGVRLGWAQAQLSDQGVVLGNTQRQTDYEVSVNCRRSAGFYPTASGRLTRVTNSADARSRFDLNEEYLQVGVGYSLPSLGDLLLLAAYERFDRPDLREAEAIDNRTDSYRVGLELRRAVAPRLSFRVAGYYLQVEPRKTGWSNFQGAGFEAAVRYQPSPALRTDLEIARSATNQSNIASAYTIQTQSRLAISLDVSARGRLQIGGRATRRRFQGEMLLDTPFPRILDRTWSVFSGYTHDINRRLRAGFIGRYEQRSAPQSYYEYSSASISASILARF